MATLTRRFLSFAHQGGGLLAPENTLAAFELGASYAPDALELDIQMTRDGEIVVIHDPTVDRVTEGHGPVAAYTLADLQRLDAGYHFTPDGGQTHPFRGQGVRIPTLREVFERFPTLLINIDLKETQEGKEAALWRTIQQAQAIHRVIVGSFVCASLRRFRQFTHGVIPTSACPGEVASFLLRQRLRATRGLRPAYMAFQVPEVRSGVRVVSPAFVRAAHGHDLAVHVWTVNERADMERLLDWGVDGIMTDRPDTLAEVLRARGAPATAPSDHPDMTPSTARNEGQS
ncbi:MAG: glycerophosphodiester phosphodiesterase [Ktedonobacterales bacterium]|jgi:glycerophosphoryl diester phosphodiesterase